jgi:surfactin synthase thioesterase subunit
MSKNDWRKKEMKLFTFPYAFGTDNIYFDLKKELSHQINVENMNYPGHGTRIQEKLVYSIEELAKDAINFIRTTNEDYALLGYSMGSKLCCEIARQLQETSCKQPKHLFLLASPPPSKIAKISQNGEINVQDARQILYEKGNTPKEVIENEELMEFIYPIVQADIKVLETYYCSKWPLQSIDIPVTVINGYEDDAIEREEAWKTFFPNDAVCDFFRFDGDHFFLFNKKENLAMLKEIILNKLC